MAAPEEGIAGITVKQGEIGRGRLAVIEYSDGSALEIPIVVIRGAEPGPTLFLSVSLHGLEVVAFEVVRQLMRGAVDPRALTGTLLIAPQVNPIALRYGTYYNLPDGLNLNRVFPGNPRGQPTQRMAHAIHEHLVKRCDYLIDFHANPHPAIDFAYVKHSGDDATNRKADEMARAFGITTCLMSAEFARARMGTMVDAAMVLGKPSLIVELTPWRQIDLRAARVGLRGTLNVMRSLGMLEGRIEPQTETPVIPEILTLEEFTADRGGCVYPLKTPGDRVTEGEPVAELVNPFGDVVDTVRAPRAGYVLAYPWFNSQWAGAGEIAVFLAYPGAGESKIAV